MKLLRSFILAGILFWLCPVHAQSGLQMIPSGQVPATGTFWLVMSGAPGGYGVAPCPSSAAFSSSPYAVYYLADGTYLVDNTAETGGLNTNELNTAANLVLYDIAESVAAAEAQSAMASPMTRMTMMASSLSSAYAYGNPVYLTGMSAGFALDGSITANFSIVGGTNFVPYDILVSTNLLIPVASWNWLGIGYTSNNYTFYEQPTNMAFYALAKPSKTMTVGIGDDSVGQCDVPYGLTNVVQVTAGRGQSLALKADGTVIAWGENNHGQGSVPASLSGVAMVSAGYYDDFALLTNGTVTAWGWDNPAFDAFTNIPAGLSNVAVIAAGGVHTLALCSNGTVAAWGYDSSGETDVPDGLTNVTAISAGLEFSLAVSNGYVVAWGDNTSGECHIPAGLSNVVDVAAGPFHGLALLQNGTVAAWGDDLDGEIDVPAGLSNVVAIAAGGDPGSDVAYSMALRNDGTLAVWGDDDPSDPFGGLSDVIGIAAGNFHALALRTGPPTQVISQEPTDQYAAHGGNATFTARGAALYGMTYQWQFNGVNISGATNAVFTVTNVQSANSSNYTVTVTDNGGMGSIVSSNVSVYIVTAPVLLSQSPLSTNQGVIYSNTVTLSVLASAPGEANGFPLSYQWQFDGANLPGQISSNYTFIATNSGTYSVTVSNAAGGFTVAWQMAAVNPGGVIASGLDSDGQVNALSTLTNVISVAAGEAHGVVALDSGSVLNWGSYWTGSNFVTVTPPPVITNALAVAAGSRHDLALLQNGGVVAWGLNDFGQTNVPTNATNAVAVAAGGQQSLVLLQNGTVLQWGQTNAPMPAGLTNVTAIAAGTNFCLALLSNSTVVAWGANNFGQTNVPAGLTNVVAIAAGGAHALALQQNGIVVAWGDNTFGETNVPAGLSNVMNIAAGDNHSIALQNNGTVVAWGDNTFGETSSVVGLKDVKLIAGAGGFTLASQFSPTVSYPIDVSQDLLLIYNTNSVGSTVVENYYLQNRPMVGGANVLGIGCITNEIITSSNFTNQILTPYLNWLNQNPTKHPQYLLLFMDIPSRVEDTITYPSVQYQLSTEAPGIQAFVSSINMNGVNGTNDCIAYINKVVSMGTNYSPRKLIISASASGYGNTNYVVDDVNNIYCGDSWVPATTNGLIEAGVPLSAIQYLTGCESGDSLPHLTNAVNLAGYISWGFHSSLGPYYATNGVISWSGNSGWWIIRTEESFNGQRTGDGGNFLMWFSINAFGGTNYSNTPIGGPTYVDEPTAPATDNAMLFGLWASGKNLAICSWVARNPITPPYLQVVGDPFVTR